MKSRKTPVTTIFLVLVSLILIAVSVVLGINVANQQTPDSAGAFEPVCCAGDTMPGCVCIGIGGTQCSDHWTCSSPPPPPPPPPPPAVCPTAGWSGCGSNGCGSGQTSFTDPTSCAVSCHDDPGTCNPSPPPPPPPGPSPTPTPTPTPTPPAALPACSDGVDNDGDGRVDCTTGNSDPGCFTDGLGGGTCNPSDPSETDGITQCNDGIDNDGDARIDCVAGNQDPGCYPDGLGGGTCNPFDASELNAAATTPDTAAGDTDIFSVLGGIGFVLLGAALALFR